MERYAVSAGGPRATAACLWLLWTVRTTTAVDQFGVAQDNDRAPRTRVGYARCSTDEQDVLVQTEQLQALGVEPGRIYIDRGFSALRI
nr:recombinase family protein [Amycolatopsis sp. CA-230715]